MAVGNFKIAELFPVRGVQLAALASGIKNSGDKDVVLIELEQGTHVAAAFTQNLFCAAPVQISKKHLQAQKLIRYLLINSGNANAGTGVEGEHAAQQCVAQIAQDKNCDPEQILVFSTGVIGQVLPQEKVVATLPNLYSSLSVENWQAAAEGIMTTDTYAKAVSKQVTIDGKTVSITGMAKGVGMVKPNMATVLAYVATDAQVPPILLQQMLSECLEASINSVTVDGDTSTNDSCVLMATGQSNCLIDGSSESDFQVFQQALQSVFLELAHQLVKDGEGATKFVEVRVSGGDKQASCKQIAYKIAESPLVKTALFASDANWGRILAAVGNAGVNLDVSKIDIYLGDVQIVAQGGVAPTYTEEAGSAVMQQEEILIHVNLNAGNAMSTVWTTDLSYDYVKINAEYRT